MLSAPRILVPLVGPFLVLATATAQQESAHCHQEEPPSTPAATQPERPHLEIPDVEVTTAAGETVRFRSELLEGKVVALNFVFTTCTTVCPPMGANFSRLQQELGERVGRDVHLISVSIDPVTDTPARLAAWGERFGAGPGWTLVTGKKSEIDKLLKALEVFTPDFTDHSPVVLVGHAGGDRWTRAYGLAPPARLIELLEDIAAPRTAALGEVRR